MIIGNRTAGRTLVTIAVALLLLTFVGAFVFAGRKKTAPEQEPPLPHSGYVAPKPPSLASA